MISMLSSISKHFRKNQDILGQWQHSWTNEVDLRPFCEFLISHSVCLCAVGARRKIRLALVVGDDCETDFCWGKSVCVVAATTVTNVAD